MAVAVDRSFFSTLPQLPETTPDKAEIAWLVYDIIADQTINQYRLTKYQTVFTSFTPALDTITISEAGLVDDFIEYLQQKLDEKLENGHPPDAPVLTDFGEEK